jgi:diguanylate cyclase (GGDEF)-like protein
MKSFPQQVIRWWFATMTPTRAPLTTIEARETMRKRRLFSVIVLLNFLAVLILSPGVKGQGLLISCWAGMTLLLAGWINQRGYLKCASLFYLLTTFLGMATTILHAPLLSVDLWPILLVLPVASQLFLPAWGALFLAILTSGFMSWFVLVADQSQIAPVLPSFSAQFAFLSVTCAIILSISIICALASATTKKAVLLADRTVELEQAHQALAEAYTGLETAHATIQRQAFTDGLTGLPNHRAIRDQLEKAVELARRVEHPLCVLFFDLDHFKAINDSSGHSAGDEALCAFSHALYQQMRCGDNVGRWGGEEFLAILPETTIPEAQAIAERIQEAVNRSPLTLGEGLHLTCSIGLAGFPFHALTQEALIHAADQAMYIAKRLGRNQVRVRDEILVQMMLTEEEIGGDCETMALHRYIKALTLLVQQREADPLLGGLERRS